MFMRDFFFEKGKYDETKSHLEYILIEAFFLVFILCNYFIYSF